MTFEATATTVSGMTSTPAHTADPTTPAGRFRRAWSAFVGRPSDPTTQATAPVAPTRPDRPVPTDHPTQPTTADTRSVTKPTRADRLRFIPPVAALGTAFVMQAVAVTDTVGEKLATTLTTSPVGWLADHAWLGYAFALLLGVAVASCFEGAAAYLMDLYDKHLLARDSVWALRLAMLAYVGASALAIHWWTDHRKLPEVTSWLLAGMSASALFLWSRGSRWRNREAMRAAGQLDPAMPKLPMAAKVLHPVRWLITLYLVSWEPVATTDEARARYEAWRNTRSAQKSAKASTTPLATEATTPVGRPTSGTDQKATAHPTTRPDQRPTTKPTAPLAKPRSTDRPGLHVVGPTAAVTNARSLRERYGDHLPTSMRQIRADLGWSKDRVDRAVEAYQSRADQATTDDDKKAEAAS